VLCFVFRPRREEQPMLTSGPFLCPDCGHLHRCAWFTCISAAKDRLRKVDMSTPC
jgi:hypothetical protein